MLAVYPAYMRKASFTTEDIEMIFFFFVHRDLLLFYCSWQGYLDTMSLHQHQLCVSYSSGYDYLFSVLPNSILCSIDCIILAFDQHILPDLPQHCDRNTPFELVGSKLGAYNALFGIGWTTGPIMAKFASDAFGSGSPYLAFFIKGTIFTTAIAGFRKDSNHFQA